MLPRTGTLTVQTVKVRRECKGHHSKHKDGREKLGKKDRKRERALLLPTICLEDVL